MSDESGDNLFTPSAYMEPIPLIREIVSAHQRRNPELGIVMGIWLNPISNLLQIWGQGVDLLEIAENLPADELSNFVARDLDAGADNPPLRMIRTTVAEINAGRENKHPFITELETNLKDGQAEVVFPELEDATGYEAYERLL